MSVAIKHAALLLFGLALAGGMQGHAQAQAANQSLITISGSVSGPTCVLSTPSQEVLLPDTGTYLLGQIGSRFATGKTAEIVLTNCSLATASRVAVSFSGPHDAAQPTHLQTSIAGLALVLTPLTPGVSGDVPMNGTATDFPLKSGTTTLPFSVSLVVESLPINLGVLTAKATFTLSYS
ncbi:type 1 fimbria pilin [Kerstersia gyiorum]|uniref:fimbrial protein n=2 Tax=Kerstersia gyiorum TaxID=206506 RepID=UPI00209E872E|nr:fimbrial protein [Kerstersia gyiorum]MCP1713741.1 type 1 fimbria pilin [Kerstersia gyiorum]